MGDDPSQVIAQGLKNNNRFKSLNFELDYHSGKFIWANPKISNTFSPIFPSFVYLVSTKPMAKWSRLRKVVIEEWLAVSSS